MRKRKLLQLLAIFMLAIDDVIDDVILAISDLLRGKPAIDSSLLLGPSTDIGSIILKISNINFMI